MDPQVFATVEQGALNVEGEEELKDGELRVEELVVVVVFKETCESARLVDKISREITLIPQVNFIEV